MRAQRIDHTLQRWDPGRDRSLRGKKISHVVCEQEQKGIVVFTLFPHRRLYSPCQISRTNNGKPYHWKYECMENRQRHTQHTKIRRNKDKALDTILPRPHTHCRNKNTNRSYAHKTTRKQCETIAAACVLNTEGFENEWLEKALEMRERNLAEN